MQISHVTPSAVLGHPVDTALALWEISWRVPARVLRWARTRIWHQPNEPTTSLRVAVGTAVYAALMAHNWQLLLGRPRWGTDTRVGLLFPDDIVNEKNKDGKHGFYGYVYIGPHSPAFGSNSLKGADAVWIHAHGGGFVCGEARMYHHCFMRWIDRAHRQFGVDLRILSVEYRKFRVPATVYCFNLIALSTVKPYPGCIDAVFAAYQYVTNEIEPSKVVIAGDSAGGEYPYYHFSIIC